MRTLIVPVESIVMAQVRTWGLRSVVAAGDPRSDRFMVGTRGFGSAGAAPRKALRGSW